MSHRIHETDFFPDINQKIAVNTMTPGTSSSQGQGSRGHGSQGQGSQGAEKEERIWTLKDCKMEVVSVGKKDPLNDESMTVDLVFTFDDDPTPKVVGELIK